MNQYEWIIATPRSNSACTLGSQDVGKLSLPSLSSCWPNALQFSAAVIPATNTSDFAFMGASRRVPPPPQWVAPEHNFANEVPVDGSDQCRARSGFRPLPLTALGILHRFPACVEGSRRHFIGRAEPGNPSTEVYVARRRLNDAYMRDLFDVWKRKGIEILEQVSREQPGTFMKCMTQLMPRDF